MHNGGGPLQDARSFWHWLAALPEGSVIGRAMVSCECPLASFLVIQFGGMWSVGSDVYWRLDGTGQVHPLPWWASQFVARVDYAVFVLGGPVVREVALAALEQVLAGCGQDGGVLNPL